MTDLHQIDPKSNPYFRNPRIRRYLINAGLINRHGDILLSSSYEVSLAQPSRGRKAKENLSKPVHTYVAEEEQKRRAFNRNKTDLPAGRDHLKKNKTNENRSPKRAKSAHYSSRDLGNNFVRRSAKEKLPVKLRCRVIMTYYGPQTIIDYDKSWFPEKGDEIIVMQQHCGGENLTVFKGHVKPNETFAFDSQRHQDYPFALALYINGLIDSRISVCCEYKHKRNVPLGGPHGSFAISDVQKVKPCRSCQYRRLKKKSKSTITLALEQSRYRRSIVPRLPPRNPSHSPVPRPRSNSSPTPPSNKDPSPDLPRTPTPEEDDKKPSTTHDLSAIPTAHSSNNNNSATSRTSQRSPDEDDKKPALSSTKHSSHVVPTRDSPTSRSPDVSRTPTPTPPRTSTSHVSRTSPTVSDADDKKPPPSSANQYSSRVPIGHNSNIQNPTASQNNNKENYSSDFDETNDDDYPPKSSRFDRPRISDPHSIDKNQGGHNTQSKYSSKNLNAYVSSDDGDESDTSTDSDPPDDEEKNRLAQILSGKNNATDDSLHSSSTTSIKSDSLPTDITKRELNENNNHNRFSSTTTSEKDTEGDRHLPLSSSEDIFGTKNSSSAKKNEDIHYSPKVRRSPSNSSEDFFGIKRSSSTEKKKDTQVLSKDWFETNSRNDPDDNDQLNLDSPPKTTSWRKNITFDDEN